jgi:hypothetical protein
MATGGSGNRRPAGAVFMGRTRRAPENLVPEPAGLDQPDACQRLASLDPLAASETVSLGFMLRAWRRPGLSAADVEIF